MSLSAVLLRVLLCVGLILNGSGAAIASAGGQSGHDHMAHAALDTDVGAAARSADHAKTPCHGDATAAATAGSGDHAPGIASDPAPQSRASGPSPDCCDAGVCSCDCAHAQGAVDANSKREILVERLVRAGAKMSAHAPPVLPHLIRPPISRVS